MSEVSLEQRRQIGAYLRSQRLRLDGRLHGPARDRRHVAHLTQSGVAELAGVSEVLVAQIETGRYPNLNERVLGKLARALRLAPHQHAYLRNLLWAPLAPNPPAMSDLAPGACSVVDAAMPVPAFVSDCCFNLLYWNPALVAMLGDFARLPTADRNVIWSMFTDPAMRQRWTDWEGNAQNLVAALRMQRSIFPQWAAEFDSLVEWLRTASEQFAAWWETTDPLLNPVHDKEYDHPDVGPLRIFQTAASVTGAPELAIVHMTPRDEETRAKFALLAERVATGEALAVPGTERERLAAD